MIPVHIFVYIRQVYTRMFAESKYMLLKICFAMEIVATHIKRQQT